MAEFSPPMLALFLEARIVSLAFQLGIKPGVSGDGSGLPLKAIAKGQFLRELATVSRVPAGTLDLARKGRVNAAMTRVKIWGALGIIPADRGVMLTDDGKQLFVSRDAPFASLIVPATAPRNGSDALAGCIGGAE